MADVERNSGAHDREDGDHLGWTMVRAIHEYLKIDEEWTQWHEDGFTWWSYQLAQRFRFDGPHDVYGIPTWWISFETDGLRGMGRGSSVTDELVAELNGTQRLFMAFSAGDRVGHRGRVYALPETAEHRLRTLADHAILSNVFAHQQLPAVLEALRSSGEAGAQLDTSQHPGRGAREVPDDMLNVIHAVFVPLGGRPVAPERRPDLDAAARVLGGAEGGADGGSDEGRVMRMLRVAERDLLVVIHADAQHPLLGGGMAVSQTLLSHDPIGEAEARALAARLNEAEWTTRTPLVSVGAWFPITTEEGAVFVSHATFHPNGVLVPTLGTAAAGDVAARADWLEHQLLG